MRIRPKLVACTVFVSAVVFPVSAVEPSWEPELRSQLMAQQGCEPEFFTNIIVQEEGGRQVVTVRAHCRDGRTFEALKDDSSLPFELRQRGAYADA